MKFDKTTNTPIIQQILNYFMKLLIEQKPEESYAMRKSEGCFHGKSRKIAAASYLLEFAMNQQLTLYDRSTQQMFVDLPIQPHWLHCLNKQRRKPLHNLQPHRNYYNQPSELLWHQLSPIGLQDLMGRKKCKSQFIIQYLRYV